MLTTLSLDSLSNARCNSLAMPVATSVVSDGDARLYEAAQVHASAASSFLHPSTRAVSPAFQAAQRRVRFPRDAPAVSSMGSQLPWFARLARAFLFLGLE